MDQDEWTGPAHDGLVASKFGRKPPGLQRWPQCFLKGMAPLCVGSSIQLELLPLWLFPAFNSLAEVIRKHELVRTFPGKLLNVVWGGRHSNWLVTSRTQKVFDQTNEKSFLLGISGLPLPKLQLPRNLRGRRPYCYRAWIYRVGIGGAPLTYER